MKASGKETKIHFRLGANSGDSLSHFPGGRIISNLDCIYIALAGFFILYGRWLSIIYPLPLNPDEAQVAANTLRITFHGFNWNALDGTTVGPLNSLILLWLNIIGWDVTLFPHYFILPLKA